jgi:hypothetical protein
MTAKVLLATTVCWPSAARLADSLASLEARVEAVSPCGHALALSRHLTHAYRYRALAPLASFAAAIAGSTPDLIVPCDDRAVRTLLALGRPKPLLEHSLGKLESHPRLMARAEAMQAAREEGLATAETVRVDGALDAALEQLGLPIVLKSEASWGGGGVIVARTSQEARRAFRKLSRAPSRLRSLARAMLRADAHFLHEVLVPKAPSVIAQRFIAGAPATSAFVCREGEVLAALHMDVVAWQGATGPAAVLRRCQSPQMDEACRRLARRFGLSGFIGLDFMREETGTAHLIEVNPRATQICHLALDADLAAAFLGRPARPAVTERPLIALFPQAQGLDPKGVLASAFWDLPWSEPRLLRRLRGRTEGFKVGPENLNIANLEPGPLGRNSARFQRL